MIGNPLWNSGMRGTQLRSVPCASVSTLTHGIRRSSVAFCKRPCRQIRVPDSVTIGARFRAIMTRGTRTENAEPTLASLRILGRKLCEVDVCGRAGNNCPWQSCLPVSDRSTIKRRLLNFGILRNTCDECGICEWRGRPLSVQIDHINGDRNDHRIENLRMLCPNCHSQTEIFGGRNLGKRGAA
jgi:hypothetical protein